MYNLYPFLIQVYLYMYNLYPFLIQVYLYMYNLYPLQMGLVVNANCGAILMPAFASTAAIRTSSLLQT